MQPTTSEPEHVPTMLWAEGVFHHPRQLHDSGKFVVDCSCGERIEDPHLRSAITNMARHVEQPPSYVIQRVL